MFSIYTVNGRTFTGPMEQLRNVKAMSASAASRGTNEESPEHSLENIFDNIPTDYRSGGHTPDERKSSGDQATQEQKPTHSYDVSNDALNSYKSMLAEDNKREAIYHAYQIMSPAVIYLSATDTLEQALKQFKKHPFHMMPVMNEQLQLIAMLSRKELMEYLIDKNLNPVELNRSIAQVFVNEQYPIITSDPVTEVRRIAAVLIEQKLDAIPIVDNEGVLRGIVSRTDILKCTTLDPPLSLWC